MTEEELQIYNQGIKEGQRHNKMSPETEKSLALMQQNFTNFEKKLDCLIEKVDDLTNKTLSKVEAVDKYATRIDVEKMKGKLNLYAWIVPILTGIVGFLMSKLI